MSAQEESFIDVNKIDRYASRVFTLAVKFFGTSTAVPSSSIRAELYSDLDDRSFSRQFLRDRNMLASLGIVINEVPTADNDTLWIVDEHTSYVQGEGISMQDARILYVLCHDMVYDQAFPYRDELRVALIKIAQIYQTAAIPSSNRADTADRKILAALVAAMDSHEALEVRYVDAQGKARDLPFPIRFPGTSPSVTTYGFPSRLANLRAWHASSLVLTPRARSCAQRTPRASLRMMYGRCPIAPLWHWRHGASPIRSRPWHQKRW